MIDEWCDVGIDFASAISYTLVAAPTVIAVHDCLLAVVGYENIAVNYQVNLLRTLWVVFYTFVITTCIAEKRGTLVREELTPCSSLFVVARVALICKGSLMKFRCVLLLTKTRHQTGEGETQ